jgi:hypothetical protein
MLNKLGRFPHSFWMSILPAIISLSSSLLFVQQILFARVFLFSLFFSGSSKKRQVYGFIHTPQLLWQRKETGKKVEAKMTLR